MKVSGNGQAKVLTTAELQQLFSDGLIKPRDLEEIRFAGRAAPGFA